MPPTYQHKGGRFVAQYDEELVMKVFQECKTHAETARRLGMLKGTVGQIVRRNGIRLGKGNRLRTHDLDLEAAIARYQAGETCREIALSLGLQPKYIEKRFHQAGVEKRRKGPRCPETNFQWKGGKPLRNDRDRRATYAVVEAYLGRQRPPGWVIHHSDEDWSNNAPENLMLFPTASRHLRFHQRLLCLQRQGLEVDAIQLARENGAVALLDFADHRPS